LAISAGCTVLFLANFHPHLLPFPFKLWPFFGPVPPVRKTVGGTPLGLIFGTAALLIFIFASALGVRKKRRLWRLGRVQTWLRAHIWLTILTIPLVAFHCGFHRGGTMPTILLVLYAVVMGSGFFGLAMQHFMPRLMTERVSREAVYEQIPHLRTALAESALIFRKELRAQAKKVGPGGVSNAAAPTMTMPLTRMTLVASATLPDESSQQAIADFLDEEALPYLHGQTQKKSRLADQHASDDVFRLLQLSVAEKWRPKVAELQQWCDDRRDMDLQIRLHHWMHYWLIVHVPLSFALLVMTFWHAYATVIYL
ncbi:MAG TPA: hypothetical protein VGL71_10120, partial [Urbifossiella sp.]